MSKVTIFVFERRNWDVVTGYCLIEDVADVIRTKLKADAMRRDVLWYKEVTIEITATGGFNVDGAVNLEVEGV